MPKKVISSNAPLLQGNAKLQGISMNSHKQRDEKFWQRVQRLERLEKRRRNRADELLKKAAAELDGGPEIEETPVKKLKIEVPAKPKKNKKSPRNKGVKKKGKK